MFISPHKYIKSKRCTKCGEEKLLKEFYKNRPDCKKCLKNYRDKNEEKISKQKKEYYLVNKTKINKHNKNYNLNNKEKIKQYKKIWNKKIKIN